MIKFGTSGFRGIMGDNFTKESVQKVAYAIAKTFKNATIIPVGFDNRFMGKMFAEWLAEVLCAYGKKVKFYTNPVPSPLIAFDSKQLDIGIMITASHNPYYYNGIKIFQFGGRELTTQQNSVLEKIANKTNIKNIKIMTFEEGLKNKKITLTDNVSAYVKSVVNSVDKKVFEKNQIKVVFNAMNGSAVNCAKQIFEKLNIKVGFINTEVNPNFNFGLPAPFEKNLLKEKKFSKILNDENFSFAVDGDGDRIAFLDENGKYYDCNYISALIYDYYLENGIKTDIVKNTAMTSLIDKIAERHNQKVYQSQVGFKNVAEFMDKYSILLGVENNGIAFDEHLKYKDGLYCAVKVCEIIAKTNTPFSKLIEDLKKKYKFPCVSKEYAYPFTKTQREKINQKVFVDKLLPKTKLKPDAVSYYDGLKIFYPNGYWGIIRFSGNENVVRLFVEMPNLKQAEETILAYEKFIGLKNRQI